MSSKLSLILTVVVAFFMLGVPAIAFASSRIQLGEGLATPSTNDIVTRYVEVNTSGVCERKGMVQIRLSMYLGINDVGYSKHHIYVTDFSKDTYIGKLNEDGSPVDQKDYDLWVASLPKIWVNNPFHNHFIYVEPTATDKEIMDLAETYLEQAYTQWSKGSTPTITNPTVSWPTTVDATRKTAVDTKVQSIISNPPTARSASATSE